MPAPTDNNTEEQKKHRLNALFMHIIMEMHKIMQQQHFITLQYLDQITHEAIQGLEHTDKKTVSEQVQQFVNQNLKKDKNKSFFVPDFAKYSKAINSINLQSEQINGLVSQPIIHTIEKGSRVDALDLANTRTESRLQDTVMQTNKTKTDIFASTDLPTIVENYANTAIRNKIDPARIKSVLRNLIKQVRDRSDFKRGSSNDIFSTELEKFMASNSQKIDPQNLRTFVLENRGVIVDFNMSENIGSNPHIISNEAQRKGLGGHTNIPRPRPGGSVFSRKWEEEEQKMPVIKVS